MSERMTRGRRDSFADGILDALACLESMRGTCPWIDEPPFLLSDMGGLDLGALLTVVPTTKRPAAKTIVLSRAMGDVPWQIERMDFDTTIPGGLQGRYRVAFAGHRHLPRGGAFMDIRWISGKLQIRTHSTGWRDTTAIALPCVNLVAERRTHASIYFGLDKMCVEILADWGMVRRLLSDREKSTDRRAALRTLVDNFFRGPSSQDDEVWVRKHLRGKTGCQWGPFEVLIRVPVEVQQDVEETKAMRETYAKLPPEDRAEWRRLIKETFRPKEASA